MAKTIEFPQFAPDLTELGTGVAALIQGCIPRADGYAPFPSLQELTNALPSACRGFYFARRSDGSIALFAGTSTRLYLLNNTDFSWADVSKGGAAYGTLVAANNWKFQQFNDLVIAVQINTPPQVFVLSSSSAFADLGGSPPAAGHISIINRFVVLSGLLSNPRRVQWCDLDAPTVWTAGVGLADYQDLPDGGSCKGLSGGDAYGVIFQEESIRSLIYAPGSPVVFQIVRISTQDTLFAEYSVISAGDKTFFCSAQGFKVITPGGTPQPIGKDRVDEYFFSLVDATALQLIQGATDPTATRVYWAFKSTAGQAGLFDKVLCYDWSVSKDGRWSVLLITGEFLAALAKPGITLELLDPVAPTPLTITGAANNGAGKIRLTLTALSNASFTVIGQNFIVVYGVVGTTEANGTWAFTQINATQIDLIGSVFTNAYVSGGKIGGSLDALGFSLDSISKAAVSQLAAFTSAHKLAFFTGPSMEAIVETSEQDGEGMFAFLDSVRVMADAPAAQLSIGWRNSPSGVVTYTLEEPLDDQGWAYPRIEASFLRARLRIPAAATWSYARGVQPNAQQAGDR